MEELRQIAGYEKEIKQIGQLRKFLLDKKKYEDCGVHIPRGVLFYGPTGVGKTLMARSIIGNGIAGVELRIADCTKENSEIFIKDVFEKAKSQAPCVLLIDELDKIASSNRMYYMERNDKTMKILLQELDGLGSDSGVMVVATANDILSIPEPLIRSGRFDRILQINPPDSQDRKKIIQFYLDKLNLVKQVKITDISALTNGYTGAQLENVINEAGIIAVEEYGNEMTLDCVRKAINQLKLRGLEGEVRNNKARHRTAVHEAGHVVVALLLKPEKVSEASIIPQGDAQGHVTLIEVGEGEFMEKEVEPDRGDDRNDIAIALGGRAAELMEFGVCDDGSISDMEKAFATANHMVTKKAEFGYRNFCVSGMRSFDMKLETRITDLRAKILEKEQRRAAKILRKNKKSFRKIVEALEDKHILSKEELLTLIG